MPRPAATVPMPTAFETLYLFLLLPLWLAAGIGDQLCHREQGIERHDGLRESLLHLLMALQIGVLGAGVLLLQPSLGSLALMLAACVAHEAVTWVDLAHAESRRRVPWYEQAVHGWQQVLPWVIFGSYLAMEEATTPALSRSVWLLHLKQPLLPAPWLPLVLAGAAVLGLGPVLHETWRCWRRAPRRPQREPGA